MKFWDMVKTAGSVALQVALPGAGSLVVGAVNKLLSKDQQLPANATGDEVGIAIAGLPPEQQAELGKMKFEVDITRIKEGNLTLRTMLESDAKNPHSTRPRIAMGAFRVVAFVSILIVSMWALAIIRGDDKLVEAIMSGWAWVLAIIAPFVGWLNSYFGTLKAEQRNRLDAANGSSTPAGLSGIASSIASIFAARSK